MISFPYILFLGFVLISSVSGHPAAEGDENELETAVDIGDAISVTKPTPTNKKKVASNGSLRDREKLRHDLFEKYDHKTIPDNITVQFGLALINFDIDKSRSTLEAGVWLRYVWTDSRFIWDEADYGGVSVLRVESDDIWKPDITLYNSADHAELMKCWKSHALIYPDGEVLWVPPCDLSALCDLKLEEFPYGENNCSMKFGSWTYDGNLMDLQFYKSIEEIDIKDYWKSPTWEIIKSSAKRTEKYYDCCTEMYPDLRFEIIFKRRNAVPCSSKKE